MKRAVLRQIDIHGFKGVVKATLELGRISVIVGPLGSGKTTLLEAVAMLGGAAGGRVTPDVLAARGLRGSWPLYRTALRSEGPGSRPIRLEVRSDHASYRASLEEPGKKSRYPWWKFAEEELAEESVVVGSRDRAGGTMRHPSGAKVPMKRLKPHDGIAFSITRLHSDGWAAELMRVLETFAIFTPVAPVLGGLVHEQPCWQPMGLLGGGLAEAIYGPRSGAMAASLRGRLNRELRKAIGALRTMTIGPPLARPAQRPGDAQARPALSFSDGCMRPAAGRLSASEVSEGARHIAALLVLLFHPSTPPFLAIDNVDCALSPTLTCYLLRRMQEIVLEDARRPQLLLTSRHPYALDALDLADERVRLYAASRARTGAVRLRRVERSHVEKGTPGPDMPRSRLWLSGGLSGIQSP